MEMNMVYEIDNKIVIIAVLLMIYPNVHVKRARLKHDEVDETVEAMDVGKKRFKVGL